MKHLPATVAALFVMVAASSADAGILYGNRVATRLAAGTGRFARFYRSLGRMEYRKDVWLFGRPLGDPPAQFCPQCGQPLSAHQHYSPPSSVRQPYAAPPAPSRPQVARDTSTPHATVVPPAPAAQP